MDRGQPLPVTLRPRPLDAETATRLLVVMLGEGHSPLAPSHVEAFLKVAGDTGWLPGLRFWGNPPSLPEVPVAWEGQRWRGPNHRTLVEVLAARPADDQPWLPEGAPWPLSLPELLALEHGSTPPVHTHEWLLSFVLLSGADPWVHVTEDGFPWLLDLCLKHRHWHAAVLLLARPEAPAFEDLRHRSRPWTRSRDDIPLGVWLAAHHPEFWSLLAQAQPSVRLTVAELAGAHPDLIAAAELPVDEEAQAALKAAWKARWVNDDASDRLSVQAFAQARLAHAMIEGALNPKPHWIALQKTDRADAAASDALEALLRADVRMPEEHAWPGRWAVAGALLAKPLAVTAGNWQERESRISWQGLLPLFFPETMAELLKNRPGALAPLLAAADDDAVPFAGLLGLTFLDAPFSPTWREHHGPTRDLRRLADAFGIDDPDAFLQRSLGAMVQATRVLAPAARRHDCPRLWVAWARANRRMPGWIGTHPEVAAEVVVALAPSRPLRWSAASLATERSVTNGRLDDPPTSGGRDGWGEAVARWATQGMQAWTQRPFEGLSPAECHGQTAWLLGQFQAETVGRVTAAASAGLLSPAAQAHALAWLDRFEYMLPDQTEKPSSEPTLRVARPDAAALRLTLAWPVGAEGRARGRL